MTKGLLQSVYIFMFIGMIARLLALLDRPRFSFDRALLHSIEMVVLFVL